MRFIPPRSPSAQSASTFTSHSHFKQVPVRNQWHRGYREAPAPPADAVAAQEGGAGPSFVSGDSHLRTVRRANQDMRRWQRGAGGWHPPGAPHQSYGRWQPPPFDPPPPTHGLPGPSYCPPSPIHGQPVPSYGPPPLSMPSSGLPPASASGFPVPPYGYRPPPQDRPLTPFVPPRPSFNSPDKFRPQAFRSSPPPRPADYRSWSFCLSQPPPQRERFVVLSYNILADYLAGDGRPKLYFHIPHYVLDWEWRKRRLLLEFRLWAPDIMCLQEVDRFHDLEQELTARGYGGIWKMRTGSAVDGCAIFWRTSKFQLKYDESIEFNKLGLRDNVAQICVLELRYPRPVENEFASFPNSSSQSRRANLLVVCNIHVLYNPKRGEIKLGQVRTLLDRAHAVSKIWNDAPVIVCGDFNSTPKSPLYNFIAERKLSLSGLVRNEVSGQYSASISSSRLYTGPPLSRAQPHTNEVTPGGCISQDKAKDNNKSSESVTDPSAQGANRMTTAAGTASHEIFNGTEIVKGNHSCSGASPSEISIQTFQGSENVLEDDGMTNLSSEIITEPVPAVSEVSSQNSTSFLTDMTMEKEISDPVPTCQTNDCKPSDASSYGGDSSVINKSLDEASKIRTEVTSSSTDRNNACCHNEPKQSISDVVSLSADFDSKVNLFSTHLENHNSGGEVDDIYGSEENSDPNFFRELLGTDEACHFDDDSISERISHQNHSSFSSYSSQLGPSHPKDLVESVNSGFSFADNSNHSYNPYLWTPRETEIASGSADSTSLEHSLKLRSVYRDVEDYAGTKDSSGEPQVTCYNRHFMGTVDYIWSSEGLQTARVLDTFPKHVLEGTSGFPTKRWGSDHVALACELAFVNDLSTE